MRQRAIAAIVTVLSQRGELSGLVLPDGAVIDFGAGEPAFTLRVHRPAGLDALASLDALTIAHAYIEGDLDLEGDLLEPA